jgi:hypothetical protein
MVALSAFKYQKPLGKEVKGDSFKIALYKFVQTDIKCTMSPNALYTMPSTLKSHKNPIKDQWPEPSQGKQKGKAKERPKDVQPAGTKKGGGLVPLVVGFRV